MPPRFALTAAEGTIKKLLALIVVFAAVIGIATWYEPFAQSYELKNAATVACNELVRNWRYKVTDGQNAHIEAFERRATQAGVKLKPSQYKFTPSSDRQAGETVCKVRITYPTKTDWFLVGAIFEIPPLQQKHVLNFEHRVRDQY